MPAFSPTIPISILNFLDRVVDLGYHPPVQFVFEKERYIPMMTSSTELAQALQLVDAGEKERAIDRFRYIIQQDPDNVQALLWLGGLTPDLDEGIAILEHVLRLDPENKIAQRGLTDLRARRQARVREPAKVVSQDHPPSGAQLVTGKVLAPATERAITGDRILSLANTIVWPFKGLNRPLGKLLDEDAVQSRDLGWAAWNASDPTVKWAAAVHLRTRDVQDISMSPEEAGRVTWPFKGLDRSMGELLVEQTITLHDLAYAVSNAYDGKVREAAAVLGAEIVQGSLPADEGSASPKPNAVSSAREISAATEEALREPLSPVVEPDKSKIDEEKKSGRLRVISGSPYLLEQEARKHRQSTILALGLIPLVCVAVVLGVAPVMLLIAGNNRVPITWIIVGLVLEGVVGKFTSTVLRLKAERDNYAAGRRGEERLVETLQCHLDGRWVLFCNLVLPDGSGDIDAVLVGPRGVFALEVKAFTGYNRNFGNEWQRRLYGRWRDLDRNPTRQARRNAVSLGEYLKHCGLGVWVEPRVVWAGRGKLWLKRPAVRIWRLDDPTYLLEDVEKGKPLPERTVSKTVSLLKAVQSIGADRSDTVPGSFLAEDEDPERADDPDNTETK